MRVAVTLFATLAIYRPPGSPPADATLVEIPEGGTVGSLTTTLAIPAGVSFLALVNGREATADRPLNDGDAVVLFPPLMGGRS